MRIRTIGALAAGLVLALLGSTPAAATPSSLGRDFATVDRNTQWTLTGTSK